MEDSSILGIETMESLKNMAKKFLWGLSWAGRAPCQLSSTDPAADSAAAEPASPASQVFEAVETY